MGNIRAYLLLAITAVIIAGVAIYAMDPMNSKYALAGEIQSQLPIARNVRVKANPPNLLEWNPYRKRVRFTFRVGDYRPFHGRAICEAIWSGPITCVITQVKVKPR